MDDEKKGALIRFYTLDKESIGKDFELMNTSSKRRMGRSNVFTIGARLYPEDVWAGILQFEISYDEDERAQVGKLLYFFVFV